MKVAIINDTHFGVRGDSEAFDNSARRFFTERFFPYLEEHDISEVIHLGDLVDRRKYINFQILDNVYEYFFKPMTDYNLQIIPGNHDVYYKNTNRINSINFVFGRGPNHIQRPCDIMFGGLKVAMIPWITEDNAAETEAFLKETTAKVCMGHFDIIGFKMTSGQICEHGFDPATFEKFDMVLSGHFHHKSSRGNIHYLGCQYEQTWDDYESTKGFHVLDTDTLELTFVENPNVMHRKLYYDENTPIEDVSMVAGCLVKLIVVNKKDYKKFDALVDAIYAAGVLDLKIVDDLTAVEDDGGDGGEIDLEDTGNILSDYIDEIEIKVEKPRLKTLMKTLFVEAQNVEIV